MRHRFWIVVLSLGAIFGFTSGFLSLHRYGGFGHGPCAHRAAFEARVAEVCVRAADELRRTSAAEAHGAAAP
jgi:hypothetical protein